MPDQAVFTFNEDDWVLPELRDFFSSGETKKSLDEIIARYSLTPDQADRFLAIVRRVIMGKIADEDLAQDMFEEAGVPYETALEIQGDMFADVLSDVGDLLAEQESVYRDLHPEEFVPPPPEAVDVAPDVARETIVKAAMLPDDTVLRQRLISIAVSYLKDVRDEAETKAVLEKPTKTGGLGLGPEKIAPLMLLLTEARPRVLSAKQAVEEQEKARVEEQRQAEERRRKKVDELSARLGAATRGTPSVLEPPPPLEAPKEKKEDLALEATTEQEKKEIEKIETVGAKKVTFEETVRSSSTLDVAVDDAVTASGVAPQEDDLKRRFRMLVSLYFRDLRDQLETKSKFTMPVASGGMGMADEEADRVMAGLADKSGAFHSGAYDKAAEEKAKYVEEQKQKVLNEEMNDQQKEQAALERAYANVLKKGGVTPPPATIAAASPPKVITVVSSSSPAGAKPASPAAAPVAAPKGATTAPAAPPVQTTPAAAQVAKPPTAPPTAAMPKPAQPAAAPMAPAMPAPAAPARPATAPGQPVVADVKFTPKLTGPVEELRQLLLKDFRRLSKDPREATLKIKDKIDLLDDLGFEVKTEGIKAWQESEPNKLYLTMLRMSLEGRPVGEIIDELDRKGQPVLNKPEFDAIMELNRKLRFG